MLVKDILIIFKTVLDFLVNLSEEQLDDLLNNKAKLKLEYSKTKTDPPHADLQEICNKLELFDDKEDAYDYLLSQDFKKAILCDIAKHYNITNISKLSKQNLNEKIVDCVVGTKLRLDTLLNADLKI